MKTYAIFPGLDALFVATQTRRWLTDSHVVAALDETSAILAGLTGREESLVGFLRDNQRPHLADFDRTLVALTAVQVGIARAVRQHLPFDGLTGCSHGDAARLVIAESVSLQHVVELLWLFAEMRLRCPQGSTAFIRAAEGDLTVEQLDWLGSAPITLSQWSSRHATAAGTDEAMAALREPARALGIKIRPVLPYPVHSPVMAPAVAEVYSQAYRWQVNPARVPLFSSIYVRPISSPAEIMEEAAAGAVSAVRWMETLVSLANDHGVTRFVNIGPSNTLTGWVLESDSVSHVTMVDAWDVCRSAGP
jgi:malonyl CoA-acyl carrier protein transacylase